MAAPKLSTEALIREEKFRLKLARTALLKNLGPHVWLSPKRWWFSHPLASSAALGLGAAAITGTLLTYAHKDRDRIEDEDADTGRSSRRKPSARKGLIGFLRDASLRVITSSVSAALVAQAATNPEQTEHEAESA